MNEMEQLENRIIQNYNNILSSLLEEGDMDTLEMIITNEEFRCNYMKEHYVTSELFMF